MSRRSYDEEAAHAQTRWNIGTSAAASGSFEIEAWAYSQYGDYALQVMQKVESTMTQTVIPSTQESLRCYMRSIIGYGGKRGLFRKINYNYQESFWNTCKSTILMYMSINYRTYFYSVYCPDEYFVSSGMVPIAYGLLLMHMLNYFIEFWINSDLNMLLLDYSLRGLFTKSPWYRCKYKETYTSSTQSLNPICLPLQNFSRFITSEKVVYYDDHHYVTGDGDYYTNPVFNYYNKRFLPINKDAPIRTEYWMHCIFLWILVSAFYGVILKKRFWNIYKYIHYTYNGIRYLSFLFILWNSSIFASLKTMRTVKLKPTSQFLKQIKSLKGFNSNTIASTLMTTPPVLHLLLARNPKHNSHPELDSVLLTISNGVYGVVETAVLAMIREYIHAVYQYTVHVSGINRYQFLVMFPLFFSTLLMKDLLSLVYFVSHFLNDFLTFVITFQCMVETICSEWKIIPRYAATIAIAIVGCTGNLLIPKTKIISLHVFVRGATIAIETFVIYWLYPLDRMFDDETFQFGKPPTLLKKIMMRVMPYYFVYIYGKSALGWYRLTQFYNTQPDTAHHDSTWSNVMMVVVPIVTGAIFMAIKLLYRQKQSWKSLFRPRPNFGPREHVTRQLRKQFDAREYVGSQSSRYLSRHIMAKAGPETYRLDVRYNTASRRSTVTGTLAYSQ